MYNFLYPQYFLLLIPIVVILLFWYFKWWKKIYFWNIEDIKTIYGSNSFFYKIYFIILLFIFWVFTSIFSTPVIEDYMEKNQKNWIDIQIVLDVSYSMTAEDLKPNRLEVAKDVISGFLDKIESDRVWIIVFSGKTFTSLPLSFDYNIIKKVISKIDVNIINQRYMHMQWTAIWDALVLAWESFWEEKQREKVIILLTDWEANKWIHPLVALDYINSSEGELKTKIYTIWIWWLEPTYVVMNDRMWFPQRVPISGIDEETLKKVAKDTWWKYFRATDKQTLEEIFSEISKLEKKEIDSDELKINKEQFNYFIYALVVLYFLFILLKIRKRL